MENIVAQIVNFFSGSDEKKDKHPNLGLPNFNVVHWNNVQEALENGIKNIEELENAIIKIKPNLHNPEIIPNFSQ